MTRETDYVTDSQQMAGRVERYSCWPTIHRQSVGEHSWQVYRIYRALWGDVSGPVAYYIWAHDATEVVIGDNPFPSKRDNPALKAACDAMEGPARERLGLVDPEEALRPGEKIRVKVCDLLEMTEHGMAEREMGNLLAVPVVLRTAEAAVRMAREKLGEGPTRWVMHYIEGIWSRHEAVLLRGCVQEDYNRSTEISRLAAIAYATEEQNQ